ncbi:FmdB family zinc ribbon protein [Rickettsiella massiliensis]|uniref:FmdB family zinc ribbon protein n=1 Tax=Rickettsiella massiliensis TaxID=676517 RepID=UPI00029B06B3|nr:zinc ribbon domain-containing protein [Rickettsiella massiliensis]
MPIYEYQCTACHHHFDTIQRFNDKVLEICPSCQKPTLQKLISAPSFHLKGTGWYVTDFKKPKSTEASPKGTETSKQETAKKEGAVSKSADNTSSPATKSDASKTDESS